jgi:hypothetical protein
MRVTVWFKFFGSLLWCPNPWYMGGKRDNKEWDFNWEHSFPRILEYERKSDIKEVDIMEFRVNAKLHL